MSASFWELKGFCDIIGPYVCGDEHGSDATVTVIRYRQKAGNFPSTWYPETFGHATWFQQDGASSQTLKKKRRICANCFRVTSSHGSVS